MTGDAKSLSPDERRWFIRIILSVSFIPAAFQLVPISLLGFGLYSRMTEDKWIAIAVPLCVFVYSLACSIGSSFGAIRVLQRLGNSSRGAFIVAWLSFAFVWGLLPSIAISAVFGAQAVPPYAFRVFLPLALVGGLVGGFMLHGALSRIPGEGRKPKKPKGRRGGKLGERDDSDA